LLKSSAPTAAAYNKTIPTSEVKTKKPNEKETIPYSRIDQILKDTRHVAPKEATIQPDQGVRLRTCLSA
jgi:hypothetical protein